MFTFILGAGFHPELHATMLSIHAGTQAAGKPENRAGGSGKSSMRLLALTLVLPTEGEAQLLVSCKELRPDFGHTSLGFRLDMARCQLVSWD